MMEDVRGYRKPTFEEWNITSPIFLLLVFSDIPLHTSAKSSASSAVSTLSTKLTAEERGGIRRGTQRIDRRATEI
jgi:hypothetical protein